MKKPEISEKFTIEDIHKIREYNAEKRKHTSSKKRFESIKKSADKCENNIKKYRKKDTAI